MAARLAPISIEERVAIAVVEIGGRLRGLDEEGVVFGEYKKAPADLPRVETDIGTTSGALKEAAKVVAALPRELSLLVDHVQVASVDKISLVLKDGRTVDLGERGRVGHQGRGARPSPRHGGRAGLRRGSVPSRPATR